MTALLSVPPGWRPEMLSKFSKGLDSPYSKGFPRLQLSVPGRLCLFSVKPDDLIWRLDSTRWKESLSVLHEHTE